MEKHENIQSPLRNIMIIGSGGSGKSTLARQLANILDLRVIHADHIYWEPGWNMRSQDEVTRLITEAVAPPGWIFEGNNSSTFHLRAAHADMLIWLDMPRWLCLFRALKRTFSNYKKHRPDMAEGCYDRFDWKFIKWLWDYPKNGHIKAEKLLEETEGKLLQFRLRSPQDVRAFLGCIEDSVDQSISLDRPATV